MALAVQLRRIVWLVCTCAVLLVSRAEAFSPTLIADLDGDGHNDWVAVDRVEPSILHIWLSGSGTATHIRSRRPVLQLAARDLDGDHVPELITAEDAGNVRQAWKHARTLHVWKKDARRGFRRFHLKRTPAAFKAPASLSFGKADPADTSEGIGSAPHREAATVRDPIAALPTSGWTVSSLRDGPPSASTRRLDFSAPRPPPVFGPAGSPLA